MLVSTWSAIDTYFRSVVDSWRWMAVAAPGERAFLEAFFVWIYTSRAHADGTVAPRPRMPLRSMSPETVE